MTIERLTKQDDGTHLTRCGTYKVLDQGRRYKVFHQGSEFARARSLKDARTLIAEHLRKRMLEALSSAGFSLGATTVASRTSVTKPMALRHLRSMDLLGIVRKTGSRWAVVDSIDIDTVDVMRASAQQVPETPKAEFDSAELAKLVEAHVKGTFEAHANEAITSKVNDVVGPVVASLVGKALEDGGIAVRKEFHFPELDTTFEAGDICHPKFERLAQYIAGGVTRMWLTGEAGTGKTFAVMQIARALGIPVFLMTPMNDKYEAFGFKDGNGKYQPTELYRFCKHKGRCILLLDEVDANHPTVTVSMNSVLANNVAIFPTGQVAFSEDKLILATANTTGEGPTLKYNARHAQDGAFTDRFEQFLHWGLHEPTEKAVALSKVPGTEAAIEASMQIRGNLKTYGIDMDWGPRRTYAICRGFSCGVEMREAAIDAGLSKLNEMDQRNALSGVN